ncbi:MAG: histidine kinase [Defluviitaleaceae bacterium]|nr:histidine kinase [Defluviitaleaceae bacterium]
MENSNMNIDPPIEVCQANSNHPPKRGDTNLAERFNWCRNKLTVTEIYYVALMVFGFGFLAFRWSQNGEEAGIILLLFLICSALLRRRFPKLRWGVFADCILCVLFYPPALIIAVFSGFYYAVFFVGITLFLVDLPLAAVAGLCGLCGLFLGLWEKEKKRGLIRHDDETGRYYELESLQNDLLAATAKIEQMSVVSERARIAREIHDNAGHEIVAAFISMQTAREGFDETVCDAATLRLYDSALERLDTGMDKIREAVHNLAPATALGVDVLHEICEKFPSGEIEFHVFGNTNHVPVHVWNVLEACLNETLTNAIKHSYLIGIDPPIEVCQANSNHPPKRGDCDTNIAESFNWCRNSAKGAKGVSVNLDTTPNIIRLCVENKKLPNKKNPARQINFGKGLRNLRHRAVAAGGSLSVDSTDEKFRVVCVIPIRKGNNKCDL